MGSSSFDSGPSHSPSNIELFPTITNSDSSRHHLHHQNNAEILVQPDLNPRLPIGVFVTVLMAVGLVGNSLVLYVYHFKMPRTVFSTFVTVLALLDLATVLVSMPIDVVIKTVLLDTSDSLDVICKVAHFEVYSTSLASGSVLLLIAVTRYTKVCRPMEPGLTKRHAKLLSLLIVVVASVLCTVTFVINGMEMVKLSVGQRDYIPPPANVTMNDTKGDDVITTMSSSVMGTWNSSVGAGAMGELGTAKLTEVIEVWICRTSGDHKGTLLFYALQAVLITAFIGIFVSLIVLHWRIAIAVGQFERRQSTLRRVSMQFSGGSGGDRGSQSHSPAPHITASMFRIFATITVIFVVSYLPHLVCLIVEKAVFSASEEPMPKGTRLAMDLAYNFPYINVLANPFIYGYRSVEFRLQCMGLMRRFCCFCCCCCCCCQSR